MFSWSKFIKLNGYILEYNVNIIGKMFESDKLRMIEVF